MGGTKGGCYIFKLIPLRLRRELSRTKRGNQGVVFFPGLFPIFMRTSLQPPSPFIKGDFYIHYLLIRLNKMKIPIQS